MEKKENKKIKESKKGKQAVNHRFFYGCFHIVSIPVFRIKS